MKGEDGSGLLCSRIHVFPAKDYPQAITGSSARSHRALLSPRHRWPASSGSAEVRSIFGNLEAAREDQFVFPSGLS